MSAFSRTFSNVFGGGDTHPALAKPAGLSSGGAARAHDRGTCVADANEYAAAGRTQWQTPLPLPTQVHATLSVADIPGTRPGLRPIAATKDSAAQFQTSRFTSPLEPRYHLPSINVASSLSTTTADRLFGSSSSAGSTPCSPTGVQRHNRHDVSDIAGTRPRAASVPVRGLHRDTLEVADINAHQPRPAVRQLFCLTTSDIQGAAPSLLHPSIPSPGKGTLYHEDIEGSGPGNHRQQYNPVAFCTTMHAGRWPLPATPRHSFSTTSRKTMLTKPIMSID